MVDKVPSKGAARELVETAADAGLGMVPLVGSALAAAFTYAVGYGFNKRQQEWFESLAEELNQMRASGLAPDFDELADDPVFLDAVVHATRAAQASHQAEKLEALRNGIANSFGDDAPDVDEQRRFFRLVDQFSPAHLRLLGFLTNPREALIAAAIHTDSYMMGSKSTLLEMLPEFANRREWYDLLAKDLSDAGLAHANLHTGMTESGMFGDSTTSLGKRFVSFISGPAAQTSTVQGP